jgi:hypothetical protein
MISARLIQRIEANWERIAASVVEAVHADDRTPHYQALSDAEIHERAQDIVRNLGFWLIEGDRQELGRRYEALGRRRAEEGVPLHEILRKLQLLKRRILDFARNEKLGYNALELYAEQELFHGIDQFFDETYYSVAKGHSEAAWLRRRAAA